MITLFNGRKVVLIEKEDINGFMQRFEHMYRCGLCGLFYKHVDIHIPTPLDMPNTYYKCKKCYSSE